MEGTEAPEIGQVESLEIVPPELTLEAVKFDRPDTSILRLEPKAVPAGLKLKQYNDLTRSLCRLARHAGQSREFARYLAGIDPRRSEKLGECGKWIKYAKPLTGDDESLRCIGGTFCQQGKLCGVCASRVAARRARDFQAKLLQVMAENPGTQLFKFTLTVRSHKSLRVSYDRLNGGLRKLAQKYRNAKKRKNVSTVWGLLDGLALSIETKQGKGGHGWHCHAHGLGTLRPSGGPSWRYGPTRAALTREWASDVKQNHASTQFEPVYSDATGSYIGGIVEAFKYAVKFGGMPFADRYHAHQVLLGKRLFRTYGNLRNVRLESDEVCDDVSDIADTAYQVFWAKYVQGSYELFDGGIEGDASGLRETAFDDWNDGK